MKLWTKTAWLALGASGLLGLGCGGSSSTSNNKGADENAETANSAGDTMSSMDESSQGGGMAVLLPSERPGAPSRSFFEQAFEEVFPTAHAQSASCNVVLQACLAGVEKASVTCSLNSAQLTESSTLTFQGPDQATCGLAATGDGVHRDASATLSKNGYSVSVGPTANGGQTLVRTQAGFDFSVEGMERKGTLPDGGLFFDLTTQTQAGQPIAVTFSGPTPHRSNRVVNGVLLIDHKLANFTTTLTANAVAWSAGCNCATSGTFQATNSNGGAFLLTLTGCGSATLVGSSGDGGVVNSTVTLDRCHAI